MTHEQLTTLADVYEELKEGQAEKAMYILQLCGEISLPSMT